MAEREMRAVLAAYAEQQPAPAGLFPSIQREAGRRRLRNRLVRGSVAALVVAFAAMTFMPGGGAAVAAVRQQVQPALLLKTNLGEAQRTIRTPLVLPESFMTYSGRRMTLGPDTPASIGRWLNVESVAVVVSEKGDGMGTMHFDLRRSTQLPEQLVPALALEQPDRRVQAVKVGQYDGAVLLSQDRPLMVDGRFVRMEERPVAIYWQTETHWYSLFVAGADTVLDLVEVAEQIR